MSFVVYKGYKRIFLKRQSSLRNGYFLKRVLIKDSDLGTIVCYESITTRKFGSFKYKLERGVGINYKLLKNGLK